MLLLLDNCEHVIDAAAALADQLLARCPGLTVLATSREPLGVPGEFVRPVDPLPDPMALRLLADRGAAARPGFRVDADERTAAACAEICRRLDGLPLAIELAAARLRMLTPRQIADRLDDRFRLLTSGSRTVLPRQQTLRAVVDWSWDLLDEAERTVLRRLSVFAGGCDLAAAEAVCADRPRDAHDVAGLLGSLVDKSLVVAAPAADGRMRYRLLETVGEYAAERLDEAGERDAAERRHLVFYRELARTTDPELRGAGQLAALELPPARVREPAHRPAARRRRPRRAGGALPGALARLVLADARPAQSTPCTGPRPPPRSAPTPSPRPRVPRPRSTERCTDAPPPMAPRAAPGGAARGARWSSWPAWTTRWTSGPTRQAMERLRVIAATYRPGLPQTCRSPGLLWFFAVMLTGDMSRTCADCWTRRCAPAGSSATTGSWPPRSRCAPTCWPTGPTGRTPRTRTPTRAWRSSRRLGDEWGAAEALSSRGEANEKTGDYARAAEDYQAAIGYAEQLGARAQVLVLRARLRRRAGRARPVARRARRCCGRCSSRAATRGTRRRPFARFFLAMWLGTSGRTVEAREQLAVLRDEFRAIVRGRSSRRSCWAAWPGWTTWRAGTRTPWPGAGRRSHGPTTRCRRWWRRR